MSRNDVRDRTQVSRGISRRRFVRDLAVAGAASPALAGALAAPAAAQGTGAPKRGGTVVIGSYQEANSLNWLLIGTPSGFGFMQMYPIFEPMLRVSEKLEPEPALLAEVPDRAERRHLPRRAHLHAEDAPRAQVGRWAGEHDPRLDLHLAVDHRSEEQARSGASAGT